MTTSRIVRGTKTRIFLCVCAILTITGIIACYNSTLSQLDESRKSSEICHQQEENLSTQLQVISDYKQRLEKSLKTEKAEHQQTKTDLENKLNEERSKNEKSSSEANLRFTSLQQHFNLLQTQHDDFKEECSKTQSHQMNEINQLQAKLKEVQQELKKVESAKENLRVEYLHLQENKENLERQVKSSANDNANNESQISNLVKTNQDLQKELDDLKDKCSGYDALQAPNLVQLPPKESASFGKLHQRNADEYEIDKPADKLQAGNVADQPPAQEKQVLAMPSSSQNVLASSSKSTTASSLNVSRGSLSGARPLGIPTMTPKTLTKDKRAPPDFIPLPYKNKKLPEGIVRVPGSAQLEKQPDEENNEHPNEAINNRYRNKIDSELKEDKKVDEAEKENGAHEEFDQPAHNNAYDMLRFDDLNDPIKNGADKNSNNNNNKHHIDALDVGDKERHKNYDAGEYKENQNDMQLEEHDPDEDDDQDEYADHLGRQKDPAIRH